MATIVQLTEHCFLNLDNIATVHFDHAIPEVTAHIVTCGGYSFPLHGEDARRLRQEMEQQAETECEHDDELIALGCSRKK